MATKCPKCQFENTSDSKFCKECGTQLTPSQSILDVTKTLETPIEQLAVGSTLASRYRIIQELGKGGMGTVYKALDQEINEEVAIKLLKSEIARDEKTIERFRNELKIARSVSHKHVCRMYDIGREDEKYFITMEYVAGEDLKSLIREKQKVPENEVLRIAQQICKGLAEAHELGIVHRDLKPQNIMMDKKGDAKVMDFGIASSLEAQGVTKTGMIIGTPDYISPEQAEGEKADQRSDIYSLGVILYEMVTGGVPFRGETAFSVAFKHKSQLPTDPRRLNAGVSDDLARLILICMEKDRERRYQTTEALLADLKNIEEGFPLGTKLRPRRETFVTMLIHKKLFFPAMVVTLAIIGVVFWYLWEPGKKGEKLPAESNLSDIQRLAVLPFANIRNDPETEFLGFALADQIIGALAYSRNVLARPSSAVRQYQNQKVDALTAGQDLKVEFIVMGYYLQEGDILRLNIELVNVQSNEMIWREPIEVHYDNVFELQDFVTRKVVDGLMIQFLEDEQGRIQADVPQNPLAYEYYLRSISFPPSREGDQLAIEMLKKSIELDASYAPAYSQLGLRIKRIAVYGLRDPEETMMAENYLLKALSLNGELLSTLGVLAMLYTETARIEEAVETTRKMLEINPNNALAHHSLGYIYRYAGMLNESVLEMEKAESIDPKNPLFRSISITYEYVGEYEKAFEITKNYNESAFTLGEQGVLFFRQGKYEQAIEYFDRVIDMEPDGFDALWVTGMKASIEGDIETGLDAARKFEQANITDAEAWYSFAGIYGLLGNTEGCIRALQRAVDSGFFSYPFMLTDSFLDTMRDDPDFQRILEIAKAKHEAFKERFFPENSLITK